ncbi:discoidin domain-containing protein [Actinoplanes sp. Pm04-4]|uniref:Discoidin domain-containing protein n=1 Tax=Paractinoplanes pyxinae TaxID=2997416 RepID=A0ABT4BB19_9ACTN|nr:discoidin domain-containing protein [Actinoplanes pyxinae]MCY1143714.1 discoidin domain-containing protein [Actinoplanes pyxinae]
MTSPRRGLLALALTALLGALGLTVSPPANAAGTLLSQNRTVTASSVESSAAPAVDGNTGTRWSSAFAASQWFQVDLGAPAELDHIAITWEAAYAKAFTIQLSTDGANYRPRTQPRPAPAPAVSRASRSPAPPAT